MDFDIVISNGDAGKIWGRRRFDLSARVQDDGWRGPSYQHGLPAFQRNVI